MRRDAGNLSAAVGLLISNDAVRALLVGALDELNEQRVVRLIRSSLRSRRIRALATAHSLAVLDALDGDEHRSVIVCQRGDDGGSHLSRLVDVEGYWRIAAMGSLGRAAMADRLRDSPPVDVDAALTFLDDLLDRPS